MNFPIDVSQYKPIAVDPFTGKFTPKQLQQLKTNIQVVRDTIIFYTAVAGIRGLGGHTGGAYSIVPEVLILDAFMKGSDRIYPVYFDEAGHRVAIQYAMSAFNGVIPFDYLLHYREANYGLYGHPEIDRELGVKFASGRLGHLWPFVNGVALANPDKVVFMLGSDGSQQEGDDAEAARLAVAQKINIKLCIDDNNVTISGHPSQYLPGYDIKKTLAGHGLTVDVGEGEDVEKLARRMIKAVRTQGPVALINKRVMAPGVPGIEGNHSGHDVINKENAIAYFEKRGLTEPVEFLNNVEKISVSKTYRGSAKEQASNRTEFGNIVKEWLNTHPEEKANRNILVIDSDLEGSTGLKAIRVAHPDVFINGGVQERGNFSASAGFGFEKGKQGIFSTFSAFLEMILSELTMARLNHANVICHFSHAGVDDIADNTCHYGINVFFADNGLPENDKTRLYFPADALQLKAVIHKIWNDEGIRFIFTTRSKVPYICREDGTKFYENGYEFIPGKDEIIREGTAGYVVSYGEMLYRALDAVEQARAQGVHVGLINKPTLNIVDEDMMTLLRNVPFVLVVEAQNIKTGLGCRFGTWLLQRGYTPKYDYMGVSKLGKGGLTEHITYQGLDPEHILEKIIHLNKQ
ncbi:MAG TPA: transketolase C-terminal domain-containing protein [Candidatus Hydrogenedens sp.]|nr:transketolase C-terminal domain-containing protein [Candidatus Hydrogenedens sp.]